MLSVVLVVARRSNFGPLIAAILDPSTESSHFSHKPLFGIYREMVPGFLKLCDMDFVHIRVHDVSIAAACRSGFATLPAPGPGICVPGRYSSTCCFRLSGFGSFTRSTDCPKSVEQFTGGVPCVFSSRVVSTKPCVPNGRLGQDFQLLSVIARQNGRAP